MMKKFTKGQTVEYFTNGNYTKGNIVKLRPLCIETWLGILKVTNKSLLRTCYLLLLLPTFATAQINGTIQKTASSGTVRGSFGSAGIDTLPRVTGVLLNGVPLIYNSATNKYTTTKVGLSGIDTTQIRTVANSESLAGLQTRLNLKANTASPTFTGTPTLPTGTIGVTQTAGNSTTALATTEFVTTADNLKANLASPNFTGNLALADNAISTTTNKLYATSGNDYFSQYATHATTDRAEYVFESGDNGFPWASDGQRWRYSYNASTSGASKDVLLIDYSTITTPNAFTAGSLIKSGGTSSQFLKADGSSDGTAYLPLTGGTLTGDNTFVTMASSTGTSQSALRFTSTLGDARVGLDNSAGTVAGGADYALNLLTAGNYPVQTSVNGAIRQTISSTAATYTVPVIMPTGSTAVTPSAGDNSTKIATTAYVDALKATSGTYTPTLTNGTNVTSSTSGVFHYSRIGNEVTVHGGISITTTGSAAGDITISLPVASAMTLSTDVAGIGMASASTIENAYLTANTTADTAKMDFIGLSAGTVNVQISFMYTVK